MTWEAALNAFADAVGSRSGQLIALGRQALVPLNIMTRKPEECAADFVRSGGGDPANNSRIRLGTAAGELELLDDADFTIEQDRARAPEFGAWMDNYDIGYSCISPLLKEGDGLVGLAALSSRSQGAMSKDDKQAFALLAAHARTAVLLRNSVEDQAVDLLAATLTRTGAAVAICDIAGRVRRLTPDAERVLASGRFARLVQASVIPNRADERVVFERNLALTLRSRVEPEVAPPGPMVLRDEVGERIVVEMIPLPGDHAFTFAASVLLIFPGQADLTKRRAEIARAMFGFTNTEVDVAAYLLMGRSPADIAVITGRTVGTVRNHVHRILAKSDCASQVEFVALISKFG